MFTFCEPRRVHESISLDLNMSQKHHGFYTHVYILFFNRQFFVLKTKLHMIVSNNVAELVGGHCSTHNLQGVRRWKVYIWLVFTKKQTLRHGFLMTSTFRFHFSMEVHLKVVSNIQQRSNMTNKERSLIGYRIRAIYKVEGAITNTYKRLPIVNSLLPWTFPHGVGVSRPTKWWF